MQTTKSGSQCCKKEDCENQARSFAARVSSEVGQAYMKEKTEHGDVLGGWEGNVRRNKYKRPLLDGLLCGEWVQISYDHYKAVMWPSFKKSAGCFSFMEVEDPNFQLPGSRDKGHHYWVGIFGPKGQQIEDATKADVYIDPWPTGGLTVIPFHRAIPKGWKISLGF